MSQVTVDRLFSRFNLREKFTTTLEDTGVNWPGQTLIREYCNRLECFLPHDFDYSWVVTDKAAPYRGNLPKRIAGYIKRTYAKKLSPRDMSIIGNLAAQNMQRDSETYYYSFTKRFGWGAGDFGDGGSCYWGWHAVARDILRENGAKAILFWDSKEHNQGVGRAWIVDYPDCPIVFNGYGNVDTITVAQILSAQLGCDYKPLTLRNQGSASGYLYINSGRGFAIGPWDTIRQLETVELDYDTCPDERIYSQEEFCCDDCGEYFAEDDLTSIGDRSVCSSCLESYSCCQDCHEYVTDDGIAGEYNDDPVCNSCAERNYNRCADCGEMRMRKPSTVLICVSGAKTMVGHNAPIVDFGAPITTLRLHLTIPNCAPIVASPVA